MSYNLFLDDIRDPKDAYLYDVKESLISVSQTSNWLVVRNFDSFTKVLKDLGIPDLVSFDHDLHYEHIEYYVKHTMKNNFIEYDHFQNKTGFHAAKFLVDFVKAQKRKMPKWFVHSANEIGRQNINQVLAKYD